MRKFRSLAVICLAIAFISSGCTKEGPEGPAGVAGPQGPAGGPGPAGPAGPAGPGAGVTYSPWYLTGTDWTATGADSYGAQALYNRAAPAITQAVIDNGLVMAYMKGDPLFEGDPIATQTFQLPYSIGYGYDFVDVYDYVLPSAGNIRFLYKSDAPWDVEDLATISFRYVILPGSIPTGKSAGAAVTYGGFTREQLKGMSYAQVAEAFKIPAEGTNIR